MLVRTQVHADRAPSLVSQMTSSYTPQEMTPIVVAQGYRGYGSPRLLLGCERPQPQSLKNELSTMRDNSGYRA